MSFVSDEESVVERPPAPFAAPSHPTDPFLNPRRSAAVAPTQPRPDRDVTAVSALPAVSVTSRVAAKRPRPSAPTAAPDASAVESNNSASGRPQARKARPTTTTRLGSLGSIVAGSAGEFDRTSEGNESAFADHAGTEGASNGILQDGGDSSDEGERDVEEKAFLAAASATVPDGHGASSAATPHPWLVTDAFHVSLWYVLRYAGSALSTADLWACRALLSLTAVMPPLPSPPLPTEDKKTAFVDDTNVSSLPLDGTAESKSLRATPSGAWTWTGTEESELLLRLILRKPHGFTGRHLEARYGDWLHMQPTLTALTERRFLWWPSSSASVASPTDKKGNNKAAAPHRSPVDVESEALAAPSPPHDARALRSTSLCSTPMMEEYDGTRVARMLLQGGAVGAARQADEPAGGLCFVSEELVRVLHAVRSTELRLFLTALRHGCKAHATREALTDDLPPLVSRQTPKNAKNGAGEDNASVKSSNAGRVGEGVSPLKDHHGSFNEPIYKNMPLGDNSLYDAIPGRKQDMIRYAMERRYSLWAPTSPAVVTGASSDTAAKTSTVAATSRSSAAGGGGGGDTVQNNNNRDGQQGRSTRRNGGAAAGQFTEQSSASDYKGALFVRRCFRDVEDEALLVARCWDTHVGPVYAPHAGLKAHLVWVTEIFHVLTANGGAGVVGQQKLKPLAATMAVAAPPTLLMLRPQLLLLLQSLQSARQKRRQAAPSPATGEHEARKGPSLRATPASAAAAEESDETTVSADVNRVPYALLPRWFTAPVTPQAASSSSLTCTSALTEKKTAKASTNSHKLDRPPIMLNDELSDEEIISSTRSFHVPDTDEDGNSRSGVTCGVPPPVQLFGTTPMLLEYRAALHAHRALYDVTDGAASAAQRFRGRNEAFVSHMYNKVIGAVRAGVAAVQRHPLKHSSSPTPPSDAARFVSPFPPLSTARQQASVSLDSILYARGNHAEHLLVFTPLYRWFSCLELLYQVLQSAHRYAEANECLRFLLYEPVYVLHHMPELGGGPSTLAAREAARASRGLSPVTYAFRYKTHKRGEWLSRLAHNMVHLKRYTEALTFLEEAQTGFRELTGKITEIAKLKAPFADPTNETAAALCGVLTGTSWDESMLPVTVQRRGRMLRVLWSSLASTATASDDDKGSNAASSSYPCSLALYHAVWEYIRDRYCRRHDRLELERLLAMLHRRLRRWTPLAAHSQLATRQLTDVAVQRVRGVRDALDCMLWREPSENTPVIGGARGATAQAISGAGAAVQAPNSSRRPALPVELFVLEHFLKKWNQPDPNERLSSVTRKRQRDNEARTVDHAAGAEERNHPTNRSGGRGVWCGAHCEGRWIRCLAHALLWDCYWAYPSVSRQKADAPPATRQVDGPCAADHDLLWLSAFQDGPLDVITPVNFLLRRRAFIADRIAQLERCSREELQSWVAAHIKTGGEEHAQQRGASTLSKEAAIRQEYSKTGSLESGLPRAGDADVEAESYTEEEEESEEEIVGRGGTRGFGSAKSAANPKGDVRGSIGTSTIPEAWKVPVGSLPLLDILRVLPLPPLWRLLRCLYLSPVTEGVPLRFSGFPDLVFWRCHGEAERDLDQTMKLSDALNGSSAHATRTVPASISNNASSPSLFCLMEVKSPSDTLSTKQISVNDILCRCGFQVCVLRVDAVHDNGEPVSAKKLR
ncbi:hypothetical protein ABB37_03638 [Leptomonas pyrrhocoris]|uniref:Fanconi-associated nuclease n=1 Tax=Leptomonas pyrrhocoris TaxID=157538 RepID=A0A0N0DW34_LEPPY|nr:hypothetical protein ABB37_03638 [Leptomonas pyrrhocoris]KPA81218.1 hypothetical protein ABB37_03638 [Leptomonas pyrrhocoris]|eukprot:XP_015659657.1 hypothetical protein ABB37_03638 [Leptomonas pyrrhocoris]